MTTYGHEVTLLAVDPKNHISRISYTILGMNYDEAIELALQLAGKDKYKHLFTISALKTDISSS